MKPKVVETNYSINQARSMENGIMFFSTRHKGHVTVATLDNVGQIKTECTTIRECENKKEKNKKELIFAIAMLPLVIILAKLFEGAISQGPILLLRFFLGVYVVLKLSLFILINMIGRKKRESMYRFHSAEHMVINAYEELKRVPNIKEIREYSRFHNQCGTNKTTRTVISGILMFFATFISNPLHMLIMMLFIDILICILLHSGHLNFLQRYTTEVATEKELRVAIEGLTVWLQYEKGEGKS